MKSPEDTEKEIVEMERAYGVPRCSVPWCWAKTPHVHPDLPNGHLREEFGVKAES